MAGKQHATTAGIRGVQSIVSGDRDASVLPVVQHVKRMLLTRQLKNKYWYQRGSRSSHELAEMFSEATRFRLLLGATNYLLFHATLYNKLSPIPCHPLQQTISYSMPHLQQTISYSMPLSTTNYLLFHATLYNKLSSIPCHPLQQTISYSMPHLQQTISHSIVCQTLPNLDN